MKAIIHKTLLYINNYDSPQFEVFYSIIMLRLGNITAAHLARNVLLKMASTREIICAHICHLVLICANEICRM
jgi:hypothetical protein